MESVDARLERRLLAGFLDALVDFAFRLLDHLLDAGRMDAAVLDELLERNASDFAAHRVEARQDDSFRRVVDDEVDACQRLERADVAALAADDAPLHLIVRQSDDRDGRLGDVVGSAALDGRREDFASLLVRLILHLLLVLLDLHGLLVLELFLCLCHESRAGFLCRQARDALELCLLLLVHLIDGSLALVEARFLARQGFFALLDGIELAVEVLLFLDDAALLALEFRATFFRLTVEFLAQAMDVFLRLEQSFFLLRLATLGCIIYNPFCFSFRRADLRLRRALAHDVADTRADECCYYYR